MPKTASSFPPVTAVGDIFRRAQGLGKVHIMADQLRALRFDADEFQSPLEELRHMAIGPAAA
jgi:hypothetical protein